MKKTVLILLFTLTLFASNAKDAAFMLDYEEVYSVALDTAKKENKILMMVIVKEPCPYCDKLVEDTLDTPCVRKKLKDFIPLVIAHDDDYPESFRPPVRPVTLFINPNDSSILHTLYGYRDIDVFQSAMDIANEKYAKTGEE